MWYNSRLHRVIAVLFFSLILSGCNLPTQNPTPTTATVTTAQPTATVAPTSTPAPTVTTETLPPSEYDPRAQTVTLQSEVLGVEKTFYIYTPPDYDPSGATRYPTLYLFRGHEREWLNFNEDSSRQGENVLDVYEELLSAGKVGPMLLVFPGISSDDNSVPGMLVNFKAPELASGEEGVGTGKFEDYFIQELLPYVDEHYATNPEQRGVDGFSLGGFMSTKIAMQHPDLFDTVGAFDGLYFYTTPDCQLDDPRDTVFNMALFAPAFGYPADVAVGTENDAPTLVCASDDATVQSLSWFIQYGPESAEPNDANFYRGEHLMEQLEAKGVENGINPILEGGHHWAIADEHMRQTLPLHWQALTEVSR